jgi:ATP-dependent Clp protease ATP-binding subunit ClpC
MVRIDMSEYMERHAVSRLVGAPPGYVGYDEGGQLTERIRRKPYSVVLLDEIEKAHPEVFNILLQVLEDGRLTDSQGRTVDFKNTVLIMTSNVGANLIDHSTTIGFQIDRDEEQGNYERMKDRVLDELKRTFRPEFLNRLDEVIVFRSLSMEQLESIVDLMLEKVYEQLGEKELHLEMDKEVKAILSKEGYDPAFGARPLRRAIQRLIENPLADELLKGNFKPGDRIRAVAKEGKIQFIKA